MKIRYTDAVGGHREGETVDTDDGSAQWLIDHAYAEPVDADRDEPTEATTRKRGRPPKTASDTE